MAKDSCKIKACPLCEKLPKILRGKVKHKFPTLTKPEIIPVTKEKILAITNPIE